MQVALVLLHYFVYLRKHEFMLESNASKIVQSVDQIGGQLNIMAEDENNYSANADRHQS